MMKKHFLLYFLIFIIIFLGIFFSKTNKNQNEKKEVVFWTLQLNVFDKYVNNIIREFESDNPDIKIKWIDIPYAEGEKRTLAAILTDNPPDLVNLTPDFSLLLAEKNALYTIKENELEQFLPSILEQLKYKNEYFGIPFYATSAITLRNSDLTNNKPKTYDELFSIKINDAYTTMINFSENDTLLKLLNKYNINSPQKIKTEECNNLFEKFKGIYDKNLIPKESLTQTHRDSLEKYMSGQIAFLVTGANFINMIKENAPSIYKSTDILPQLTATSGNYDYSLMNFIIPKKAKNKKEALSFALFLTNETNQLEFAQMTPILPANKHSLSNDYFKVIKNNTIEEKARIISAKQLEKLQQPIKNIKNKKELNKISSDYVQKILIKNSDIKETLENFSQDWEKLELEN